MNWSLSIGRLSGIPLRVHLTFLLFVLWIGLSHYWRGHTLAATLSGVGFILALFGCVLLHELGHALAARKFGIPTRDITLLPIGGVARLERMPDDPRQELWVALAGPLVNVVIAALLYVWMHVLGEIAPLESMGVGHGPFLHRLMLTNLFLVGFNLLPAFPMDGGRVLRALLALRMDYTRATQAAASVGQAMAFLFGLAGMLGNPMLLFIAFFVWIGASEEANMTMVKSGLSGLPVEVAMQTRFTALRVDEPLWRAAEEILEGTQHDFPVLDESGRVVGLLRRDTLLEALAREGRDAPVGRFMQRDVPPVEVGTMLEPALAKLRDNGAPALPVTHAGKLVGLLTAENVGEFLMIQSALRGQVPRRAPV